MPRRNWSREELIVAFNLYCKTPFGRIHNRNPEIISLAHVLGRTPSALSWKLANFSRLDPTIASRELSGATHGGKLEEAVWDEFNADWNRLAFESEQLLAQLSGTTVAAVAPEYLPEGRSREPSVMVRVNQGFFRASVLASYDAKCCITGLSVSELLSASHIIPWSVEPKHRTNPRNGLCLNAIHDRAFDRGLISVDDEFRVIVSSSLKARKDEALQKLLFAYNGAPLRKPRHFLPDPDFLRFHRESIFRRA